MYIYIKLYLIPSHRRWSHGALGLWHYHIHNDRLLERGRHLYIHGPDQSSGLSAQIQNPAGHQWARRGRTPNEGDECAMSFHWVELRVENWNLWMCTWIWIWVLICLPLRCRSFGVWSVIKYLWAYPWRSSATNWWLCAAWAIYASCQLSTGSASSWPCAY